jgi:NFU1 iron-sulfur cluster scaffold homolog, mitochondrial
MGTWPFYGLPEYLAPRLGMDTQTLRAAMQSGEVVSQSEIGVGTDAGKTRLIIGSSQRIWAAEITNDGTAYEIPAPRAAINATNDRITLRDRIRGYLMDLAKTSAPITYGQLARALGLYAPGSIGKVTQALEATMVEDSESGVPFLAALVVSKIGDSEAAKGFHLQAQALGRGPSIDEDDTEYYRREFKGAIATITASSTVKTSRT